MCVFGFLYDYGFSPLKVRWIGYVDMFLLFCGALPEMAVYGRGGIVLIAPCFCVDVAAGPPPPAEEDTGISGPAGGLIDMKG